MSKFNLQSLAFALVVLLLVFFGKREGADKLKTPTASSIEVTSLALLSGGSARAISSAETFAEKPAPPTLTPMPPQPSAPIVNPYKASALESKPRVLNFLIPEPIGALNQPPMLEAAAVLVSEIGGYAPYFEENIDKRWPLASLTKLMTAVVALENLPAEQRIIMSERALNAPGQAGNFAVGEVFTAVDLIKAAIIISSNDAAMALADFYGYDKFIDLMQIKAADLGMRQTTFFDPAGLSVLNQSTANDLEKLVSYILTNHDFIFKNSRATSAAIQEINSGAVRILANNNRFAGAPDFLGGKTGYTDDAGGNLISLFRREDREFLIVVFGTSDRFGATEKLYDWLKANF